MTLGILGGGQLAQMLALAARPLGIDCVFIDPNAASPAATVAAAIVAAYDDPAALHALAARVSVATYEFENVPDVAARELAARVPLLPSPESLRVSQDRLIEKETLRSLGIAVPEFHAVDDAAGLARAVTALGTPCVLKTRRLGYDGKGQTVVKDDSGAELSRAFDALGAGRVPLIAEAFVRFDRELSQLAVRDREGAIHFYPLTESRHEKGILRETHSPSPSPPHSMSSSSGTSDLDLLATRAREQARRLAEHLRHVGVICLELFEREGELLANEMAPRVHNSGHWTIEGAVTSQFENHVRAVMGLPLGETHATAKRAAMLNLIGDVPDRRELLALPGVHAHLYGKRPAPGRKLGHVTLLDHDDGTFDTRLVALRALVDSKTVLG